MYTRPKLADSVTVEELLTMRECGLGNAKIAKRLDTSPATIYKYIGKQPKELNKPTGYHAHKARQNPVKPTNVVEAAKAVTLDEDENIDIFGVKELPDAKPDMAIHTRPASEVDTTMTKDEVERQYEALKAQRELTGGLRVVSQITHAEGARARYTIDTRAGTVKIADKTSGSVEVMDAVSLQRYIDELTDVRAMLK